MKWEPKSIHDSVLPILVLNWLTGLSILEYPLGKPRPAFTFIYVLLINFIYWFVIFYNRIEVDLKNVGTIGENIIAFIIYINIFIAISSILIGWYHYKVFNINIKRLELLDVALERLGLPNNYREIFINSVLKAVMWIVMVCVLLINDIQSLMTMFDWVTCLHLLYLFHTPLHLNSVVDLTFTSIVNCIGTRFKDINLLLQRTLSKYPQPKTVKKLYPKYSRVSVLVKSTEFSTRISDSQQQIRLLILTRHLHMELSQISWKINKIYQIQMTLEMGAYFAIVTGLLYNLFITIFFSKQTFQSRIRSIISFTIWCVIYGFRLFKINSVCASVSKESRKTNDILYELKSSNEDEELKEEIVQFSLQLTQRPLVFSPCGLITLNCTFVQRFIGSVTTYLVILIQMSPEISD